MGDDWTGTAWEAVNSFVRSHRLQEEAAKQAQRWLDYGRPQAKQTA